MRKSLIGSGDRSERIRTQLPAGPRHRTTGSILTLYKIDAIMDGDLDELTGALAQEFQAEQLVRARRGEDAVERAGRSQGRTPERRQHQGNPASALPSLETARLTLRSSPRPISTTCTGSTRICASCASSGGLALEREETRRALLRIRNYGAHHYEPGLLPGRAPATTARVIAGPASSTRRRPADVEVGYRLLHAAWGHGYATVLASALIRYRFRGTLTGWTGSSRYPPGQPGRARAGEGRPGRRGLGPVLRQAAPAVRGATGRRGSPARRTAAGSAVRLPSRGATSARRPRPGR